VRENTRRLARRFAGLNRIYRIRKQIKNLYPDNPSNPVNLRSGFWRFIGAMLVLPAPGGLQRMYV
jgi:hypothetical protein